MPDRRVSYREGLIVLMRLVLGGLFVYASLNKIVDPEAFAASITGYRIIGPGLSLIAATVVPWVELLCGFGLITGIWLRGSAALTTIMLVAFTAAVGSALWRGLDVACGCYTQDPSVGMVGWWKIGENALLTAMAFIVHRNVPARVRQPLPEGPS